jgi:hypothetical protein
MWRLECENIVWDYHEAVVLHEKPRFFRWRWVALLAAHVWIGNHPMGAASVSERRVHQLPPGPGGPYRLEGMTTPS